MRICNEIVEVSGTVFGSLEGWASAVGGPTCGQLVDAVFGLVHEIFLFESTIELFFTHISSISLGNSTTRQKVGEA